MRCLVTGVAGFIGSHLAERLVADAHEVVGVDAFTDYYDPGRKLENLQAVRESPRFELHNADMLDCDLDELLDGADAVFHLSAQPGVRRSWGASFDVYVRDNVLATQRLLEALKRHPRPAVYASSSSVYGAVEQLPAREDDRPQPISPYGVTKLAAEHLAVLYAREFGVPVTSVRYFTVFGPRQRPDMAFTRFIEAALADERIEVLGTGEQTRDFTYVSDAVEATILALRGDPGRVYNVGGGNRTALTAAIDAISQLTGRELPVVRRDPAAGDPVDTAAETTRARTELGWEPKVGLKEGLAAQVEWARNRR